MLVKFVTTEDSVGRLDGFTVGEPVELPDSVALRWIARDKAVAVEETPAPQGEEHPPAPAEAATEVTTPEAAESAATTDPADKEADAAAEGKTKKPRRGTRKK